MKMEKLEHDLLTCKYTTVYQEKDFKYHAPNYFTVSLSNEYLKKYPSKENGVILQQIKFQEGPINEVGVNGVCNEDLLAMVITRLKYFNKTDFKCKENSMAITKLEESLLWLRMRTISREQKGILGTHIIE
jgi:hypothetical protein